MEDQSNHTYPSDTSTQILYCAFLFLKGKRNEHGTNIVVIVLVSEVGHTDDVMALLLPIINKLANSVLTNGSRQLTS